MLCTVCTSSCRDPCDEACQRYASHVIRGCEAGFIIAHKKGNVESTVAPVAIRVGSRHRRTGYGYCPFCDCRVQDLFDITVPSYHPAVLVNVADGIVISDKRAHSLEGVQSTTHSDQKARFGQS